MVNLTVDIPDNLKENIKDGEVERIVSDGVALGHTNPKGCNDEVERITSKECTKLASHPSL